MSTFVMFCYFQVHYMLHWHSFTSFGFHFRNEILINYLITKGNSTYKLNFGSSRWSALNMGFVDKRSSKMQRRFYFNLGGRSPGNRVGRATIASWNQNYLSCSMRLPEDVGTYAMVLTPPSSYDGFMAQPRGTRPNDMSSNPNPQPSMLIWTTTSLESKRKPKYLLSHLHIVYHLKI